MTIQHSCLRYACPWRWILRIIWDTALLLIFAYGVLAIWILALQDFARRFAKWFFLALLLFTVFTYGLVACGLLWGPFFKAYATSFVIVAIVIFVFWMLARHRKQAEYP